MHDPNMSTVTARKNARIQRPECSVPPQIRKNRNSLPAKELLRADPLSRDLVRRDCARGGDVERPETAAQRNGSAHITPLAHERRQPRTLGSEHEHQRLARQRE